MLIVYSIYYEMDLKKEITCSAHTSSEYLCELIFAVSSHFAINSNCGVFMKSVIFCAKSSMFSVLNTNVEGLPAFQIVPEMSLCITGSPYIEASAIAYENVSWMLVDTKQSAILNISLIFSRGLTISMYGGNVPQIFSISDLVCCCPIIITLS